MAEVGGDVKFKQKLEKLEKGVCLIRTTIPFHDGNQMMSHIEYGTGFHWSGGWVMTASHCLDYGPQYCEFIFPELHVGGANGVTFGRHPRRSLSFKLWSEGSDDADPRDKDMAMIKLGWQSSYKKKKEEEWEKEENDYLSNNDMPQFLNLITDGYRVDGGRDRVPVENIDERGLPVDLYGKSIPMNEESC